ncbi:MAG: transcription elongation factor GreA [bacterium]|nr:transcription elongation factor GreA [bacterium]
MAKYFTKKGLEKLEKELDFLKKNKRKEISERIRQAASFGDLKENAAYDDAKDSQAFLEGRISELEEAIRSAMIVEESEKTDKVQISSTIKVSSDDGEEKYQIVLQEEVNVMEGKISYQSPLGSSFLGKKIGETVKIETPSGEKIYKIVEIS